MRGVTAAVRSRTIFILTFQLTRLMRGVTALQVDYTPIVDVFQLTRLMRGVTERGQKGSASMKISTHTPHARRDRVDT